MQNRQDHLEQLSYYPFEIEKNNCLGATELASGKTLKSCEINLKAVFLAECLECAINVWIKEISFLRNCGAASVGE